MLVTGASRGFGAACVEVFAAAGWDVVASSRAPAPGGAPRVDQVVWDVTDDDAGPLHSALGERPLDLLINNAGAGTPGTPLEDVDVATLLSVCDVNVGGVIRATRAALPSLRLSPAPLVLNISSRLGSIHDQAAGRYRDFGTSYAYRISKAAQNMATTCLAHELAPQVRVWAVHPGRLATGMGRSGAAGDPIDAATKLLELAGSTETHSPRFLELAHGELEW
ncbi:SDR family oxidoreductase [Isoptericola hypogeus]|uniref:SDR family oxidoreductase n=1 Tax=Isoptericola hypogeus TaxID=300179 RepID=A0ABP4UXC6_9MICO